MFKLLTAVFGAGFFGSLIAMRKYLGIALIMIVSATIFKADITDYIKQSSKQSHEERLAQINLETEKFKIEAEAKALREAKEKAEVEFYQKETKRLEQEQKLEQEKKDKAIKAANEKIRIANALEENKRIEEKELWRSAKTKMCSEFQRQYVNMLKCAVNSTNPQLCEQGHDANSWFKWASGERVKAINSGCDANLTNWQ